MFACRAAEVITETKRAQAKYDFRVLVTPGEYYHGAEHCKQQCQLGYMREFPDRHLLQVQFVPDGQGSRVAYIIYGEQFVVVEAVFLSDIPNGIPLLHDDFLAFFLLCFALVPGFLQR